MDLSSGLSGPTAYSHVIVSLPPHPMPIRMARIAYQNCRCQGQETCCLDLMNVRLTRRMNVHLFINSSGAEEHGFRGFIGLNIPLRRALLRSR